MRLTTVILIISLLQVSASGIAQKISLNKSNATLKSVFNELRAQSGYNFFYTDSQLKRAKPVSIKVEGQDLKEVLKMIFSLQPLTYEINSSTITLKDKPVSFLDELNVYLNKIDLDGKVLDKSGNPLAGATVKVRGSKKMVVTNENGRFSLLDVNIGDVLLISYLGYEDQEVLVSGTESITISMTISESKLDEVAIVSTGYQSLPRERMTGSFSSVQVKRLENKLQPSLLTALEGQAAGMVVTKEGKLEIRGRSTFLANSEPLVVVDGFPISGGLETVNIDNVESITILKDAVAASIYGARSSNGVIVITTKSGRAGSFQMSYKGSTGVTLRPDLSYMNRTGASDYIEAEIAAYNISPTAVLFDYDYYGMAPRVTQLLVQRDRNLMTQAQVDAELVQLRQNDGLGQLEKYVFRSKLTQQHNLSFSAGNDKNMTNAAIRYIANRNNMIGNKDNRVIVDLKNDWKPVKDVTIRLFTNINFSNGSAPFRTAANLTDYKRTFTPSVNTGMLTPYSSIADAAGAAASVPVTRPDLIPLYAGIQGLKPMTYEPLRDLLLETNTTESYQARLGGSLGLNIISGLSAEVGGIWTRGSLLNRTLFNVDAYRVRAMYNGATSRTTNSKHYVADGSIVNEARNINEAYTFRGQLNFNKTFTDKHRITAIAGAEVNKDFFDNNTYPTRYGYNEQAGSSVPFNYADFGSGAYSSDYLLFTSQTYVPLSNGGYALRDNRYVSMYANGSYEYDNRFLISGSARIDQANFFGTNPKYRYKPNWSAGGTYKLSNEHFFDVSWIDKLNLRGSYGINGNISLTQGPYLLLNVGGFSPTSGGVSYSIATPPNADLRWERTHITNIGADLSFLKGRLNATLDYYKKLSKDLLAPDMMDATYGRETITRNAGTAVNKGIELSLDAYVIKAAGFTWNTYFNGSYNTNKVIDFNYNYQFGTYLTLGSAASNFGGNAGLGALRAGYPIDAVFSNRFAGLNDTGTPTFYNSSDAKILGGAISVNDMVYSGTTRPKYSLNVTNTFSYRNFDLSFMLVSQLGFVFRRDTYFGSNIENKYVAERWRKAGDEANTIYPRLSTSSADGWYYPYSDILVERGNYIKLRDLTLGYTFNNRVWGKSGFNNIKLYFQGRNLWMATANNDNIDPETMTNTTGGTIVRNLPLRPEFYFGLSVNF
ncbi:SusC/RagA family TonB-linked outer membrane protein [Pedobacter sp. GR22-6]|uniref:SusC/RagA family TonB-linked outer membrane protein n=1 Tax=Pedobacter sp. GR22-6 TaxID=3127957 RepID=UPI00307F3C43